MVPFCFNSSIGLTAVLTSLLPPEKGDIEMFQFLNRTNRCSDLPIDLPLYTQELVFQFLNRTNRCSDSSGMVDTSIIVMFQFLNRTNRCSDQAQRWLLHNWTSCFNSSIGLTAVLT